MELTAANVNLMNYECSKYNPIQFVPNYFVADILRWNPASGGPLLAWFSWDYGNHDDVIKWKHFPHYWPFVRGIHRSPVNSPHKGQWRGALMFSLICARINGWVNNREAGDLRRHQAHCDVIVMMMNDHIHHLCEMLLLTHVLSSTAVWQNRRSN